MRLPGRGMEALIRTRIAALLADPEELISIVRSRGDRLLRYSEG
jgi:hypothetical protein